WRFRAPVLSFCAAEPRHLEAPSADLSRGCGIAGEAKDQTRIEGRCEPRECRRPRDWPRMGDALSVGPDPSKRGIPGGCVRGLSTGAALLSREHGIADPSN